MATKVVILIQSNPTESHRPCEGIRIALGLSACNHEVDIILTNGTSVLLTDDLEECVDGELAKQYLPSLKNFIPTFYVEKGERPLREGDGVPILQNGGMATAEYPITFLSRMEISKKIAAADCFATF